MVGNGLRGRWIWSWVFSSDGSMERQLQLCRDAKAGILIKVIDGRSWQGRFDTSSEGITSAGRAAQVARWFKERGVPVALWSVPRGVDDGYLTAEISLCRSAIAEAKDYIEAFVLDAEPFSGFWVGTEGQARRMVREIRGTVPVYVAPDGRPWQLSAPIRAFCEEVEGIAPQMYWETFAGQCGYYRRAGYDCAEVSAGFLADVSAKVFRGFGKRLATIGQGDSTPEKWRRHFDRSRANGYEGVTSWRQGVTPDSVRRVFSEQSWLDQGDGGGEDEVSKLNELIVGLDGRPLTVYALRPDLSLELRQVTYGQWAFLQASGLGMSRSEKAQRDKLARLEDIIPDMKETLVAQAERILALEERLEDGVEPGTGKDVRQSVADALEDGARSLR